MAQETVDFAAVARVSRYSELKDIRLIDVTAKCDPKSIGALEHEFTQESALTGRDNGALEVKCMYRFIGRAAEKQAIDISITYLMSYSIKAKEPLADDDVTQFASSNGVLHSWPFVREFLHGLTGRMGFPPFKLGVMHFVPMKPAKKEAQEEKIATEKTAPTASK